MHLRLISKFVICCAFAVTAFFAVTVSAYKSPGKPTGYVNDFAQVISLSDREYLEKELVTFQASTTNEVSVVTVVSLGGDTVEEYAVRLFKEWQIGKKDTDNGILLLVATESREVRIEVGYGLEGALPDSVANRIIQDDMIPFFITGQYSEGIKKGISSIILATRGEYTASSDNLFKKITSSSSELLFGAVILLIFIFQVIVAAFGASKSWWAGGVIGGIAGIIVSFFIGFVYLGLGLTLVLIIVGLFLDFLASRGLLRSRGNFLGGSSGGGRSGGGFGGFGGGSSGGGGASGRW